MNISPETCIDDARRFQQFGEYDLAIESLKTAQSIDIKKKHDIEIQKLMSFNCRKLGNYNMALLYINNALNSLRAKSHQMSNKSMRNEYAICLMNKGVVYEEKGEPNKAINCYLEALDIFLSIYKDDIDNYGIIINALFTIGSLYYNQHKYPKAKEYFEKAIDYFENDKNKEQDRRYIALNNILREIEGN